MISNLDPESLKLHVIDFKVYLYDFLNFLKAKLEKYSRNVREKNKI